MNDRENQLLPIWATVGNIIQVSKTPETAKLLRKLRQESGTSLRQAATDLGVAPSHLSRVERGEKSASDELTDKVANYYGVNAELVQLEEGRIPSDILGILNTHPEVLRELRERFRDDAGRRESR